jgi:hypothetical protein
VTFAFTVLEAPASKTANKIISPTSTVPYDMVTYWKAYPRELLTLEAMPGALEWLADRPRMMIVRGGLLPPVPLNMWVRRTYADHDYNHFEAVDRAWIPFDFDGTRCRTDWLMVGRLRLAACIYVRSFLPRSATCALLLVRPARPGATLMVRGCVCSLCSTGRSATNS